MDIKKRKVKKNCEWSVSTQKKLAATLGVSALVSLTACDPVSTSGSISAPDENLSSSSEVQPTCGEVPCDGESSSSVQPNSSSVAPVSGISSANDVINSSSSVAIDSLEITSGEIVPPFESSSSFEEYPPQAGILPPPEELIEPESGSPMDQGTLSSSSQSVVRSSSATAGLSSSFSDAIPSSSSEAYIDTTLTVTAGLPVIVEPDTVKIDHKDTVKIIEPTPLSGVIKDDFYGNDIVDTVRTKDK